MKPNLLIAGCGKCGTTTLSFLLDQHPDIYMSQPKEPNFLSYEINYKKGWDWYENLFIKGQGCRVLGDSSVSYTLKEYEDTVAEKIRLYLPDIKVIYIARNPFKRLESVFKEHHHSGYENGWLMPFDLHRAVEYRPEMLINSLYWDRTEYLRKILPERNILYLCLEDLENSPSKILNNCFRFLGLKNYEIENISLIKKNISNKKKYDGFILRSLKRNNLYDIQPKIIKYYLNKYLRNSFSEKNITWDDEFRTYFIDYMKVNVSNYLNKIEKPPDFWGKEFI